MAIAFIAATSTAAPSGNPASVNITKPSGVSAGDLVISIASYVQGGTVTNPTGFTTILSQNASTGVSIRVAYKILTGSEGSSFTWATNAGNGNESLACVMMAFSGVDNATPIRSSASNGGVGTSRTSPALTGTQATDMVVLLAGARPESNDGGANNVTAPSTGGWTKPAAAHTGPGGAGGSFESSADGAYQINGTTGAFTANFSSGIGIGAVSLRAAATPTGTDSVGILIG